MYDNINIVYLHKHIVLSANKFHLKLLAIVEVLSYLGFKN